MNFGIIALWVMAVLFLMCCILAAGRFIFIRSRGTTVLVRRLPAKGIHGWRHGVVFYNGDYFVFYKLRSLSPKADLVVSRLDIELTGTRRVNDAELDFITEDHTVQLASVSGIDYEMAFTSHGLLAFAAWVEASPSKRKERIDYRKLRDKATRPHNSGTQAEENN